MDPSGSSPEVEAKLALPGPVYWRLRDDPGLLGLSVTDLALERQTNLFYDSVDGALRRAGAVLRARRISGRPGVEWTLKLGRRLSAGIQTADETIAWGSDADDPLTVAEGLSPVAEAVRLAGGPLRTDAASLADRLLLEIAAPSGGKIGVSLDRLRIPGDPVFVDYELEAEAHGASRSDVEALAADLSARFGVRASTDSKRARLQEYAEGRLGPPRTVAASCAQLVADAASRRGDGGPTVVAVSGLASSQTSSIAQSIQHKLTLLGIACSASDSPEAWSRAGLRVWVGSSVHCRLRRYLDARGEHASDAFVWFAELTSSDRRSLEWRWREADLVALADEPSVPEESLPSPENATAFRPDDFPTEDGGRLLLQPAGEATRLTFVARAWPADLATAQHSFELGAPAERVAEVLSEIGYEEVNR